MGAAARQRWVPEVPEGLRHLLDERRGALLPPIRAEIFGPQRFAEHGRSLGLTHTAARPRWRAASFFPRLRSNIGVLREAQRWIGTQAATGYDLSPAAEWLLDNFHLIEAQLDAIHQGLPRSYFRALPVLREPPLAGLPRVYGVAWAFVAHTDGAFDEELLIHFLQAYQSTRELTLGEMWALPTTLRVVLVENLRRLAERVAAHKAARELANRCCDELQHCTLAGLDEGLAALRQRGVAAPFLAQMALRLHDGGPDARAGGPAGLDDWLHQALPDTALLQAQQRADQTADNLSVSNAVNSLRAVGDADWPDLVARASALMQRMLGSPLFEAEAAATRDQTLHGIERLALRSGRSEDEVACALLALMQPAPGAQAAAIHWLHGAGRPALVAALGWQEPAAQAWRSARRALALPGYLAALVLGTAWLLAWTLPRHPSVPGWMTALAALLALWPASQAVVAVVNRLVSESARPRHLPRLALATGLPAEHRVLVVVPAMLTSLAGVDRLAHRLRLHHLANAEPHAQFALLSDWADAPSAQAADDDALLARARERVAALNRLHPRGDDEAAPRFILLHRPRRFSVSEQAWIGWERKRGKLEQLVAALATGASGDFFDLGAESQLAPGARYVITLDSDTELPPGRLRELVGVAAHPHNQPRLDESGRRVVSGFGILQPRLVTPLPAPAELTAFHWLFAGQCGIDPYSAATSEVYQDLFDEGSFTGKGLLHVAAVHAVLGGRLPEGAVLSHDLLEGALARCGTVSEVTLIEDAPFHADVAASRVHRWMRGDWQLLPLLLQPWRWPLRGVNRWKLFDNLRRSLVAPASLALVVLSLVSSALTPLAALVLVMAALAAGPLMGALAGLSPPRAGIALGHFYRQSATDAMRALLGGTWMLAQLGQQAMMALDAIGRTLWRLMVSRRRLLQWTTAEVAQTRVASGLAALARQHRGAPLLALGLAATVLALGISHPWLAVFLCTVWAASPLWTWWVSRPWPPQAERALSEAEAGEFHDIARDTWRLFERCVGPDDLHLPPDNLQTLPHDMVAHRTSPTNIGLYLLSAACAQRFGWIGTVELLGRLEATLGTLDTLARHRGHFLNWYDTQTGAALRPMYLSTVDSGNLCGHLNALAEACLALAAAPLDPAPLQRALAAARRRLQPLLAQRRRLTPTLRDELRWALADHRHTRRSAALDAVADAATLAARLVALAARWRQLAGEAEFGFLFHRRRRLFHIGYRLAEQQLDAGYFDLLASEARLTSVHAIAQGSVPVSHWAALGRPFYALGTQAGLRSWSGSMFEYLMPGLVLGEPPGSVLDAACHTALREQIAYGEQQKQPWGISESAHSGRDHTLAYQYAPQGVPRLALRRTPPGERVVAPYATALAAPLAPLAALANFAVLQALGARSRYGFIEALDYTASRQTGPQRFTPVSTFMAHHQGMTIVALANLLLGDVARRWGMAVPAVEAVASLLQERTPREVSRLYEPPAGATPHAAPERSPGLLREVLPGGAALEPTHLLGNGRYAVSLRANGAGSSRWDDFGLTRWRDDALRDALGHFFYLRWDRQPRPVSITQHPAPDPAAQYASSFHADRVVFDAEWPELQTRCTVWVSPEDDIEFRQVELRNLSGRTLDLELMSAFEPTLADPRADEAHAAFSNLFLRAHWLPGAQGLRFERQPRLATEAGLQAAHFLAERDPQVIGLRLQVDRQRWLGRNHAASQPLARFEAPPPADAADVEAAVALDTGLDPVCALALRLRIAPHGKARLTFATAASADAATLHAMIDKYRQPSHVERASLMSATLAGIRLQSQRLGSADFAAVQTLTTALVFHLTHPQPAAADAPDAASEACDRRLLWRFGISGDRPIVLVSAGQQHGLSLLRALAQALRLWAWGGVACDLVVVNAEAASYQMPLQQELGQLRDRHAADGGNGPTQLHVLRAEELTPAERSTLRRLARVRLRADGRPLAYHVGAWAELHELANEQRRDTSTTEVGAAWQATGLPATALGEFHAGSGEFRFEAGAALRPSRPWINVLANPGFGTHLSEAGGGHTWALNSRLHQLTGWSNDPVADPPSEWFLVQDRQTRQAWSVAPSAWGDDELVYEVAHGQGSSRIHHRRGDLEITATWCVDADTAVKQVRLQLVNRGHRTRHLRLVGLVEWVMGAGRADRATVHTRLLRQRLPAHKLTALLCTQHEAAAGFGGSTAFFGVAGATDEAEDWTCDRRECFDARGALVLPDHFGQRSGAGLDPCAALALPITLAGGASAERVFLLGHADSLDAARQLAATAAAVPAAQRLTEAQAPWRRLLQATTVATPDPLFDAMVNRWLLYQAVSCRLWAKAGFYQAGGATGFRDQLQDAMALAWAAPQMLREQILRCAARQFPEGDVQHWWHSPGGAGVRTHFSDDLLWLPHACAHHLRSTGDATLLDEQVPFIEGGSIPEGAEDLYETPEVSDQQASVYEHAARAIDRSLRVGVHGLPLMGTGDWNDGMNRVGHGGRGESVWLGWFLCRVVAEFAPLARARGDEVRAQRWDHAAAGWTEALRGPAWDGAWFKRAFFDDGQALGASANAEARIDLIAQAWAVLSEVATPPQQMLAMAAADTLLMDARSGLIRLLDPPLQHSLPSAGYIQAYPPGVRENGGQYTHAGVWALMAQARRAQGGGDAAAIDAVYRSFTWLSPAHRANHPDWGERYGLEPYAVAGDVRSQPPRTGHGGWSWYTGAAAWLHRAAIESLFGLQIEGTRLRFQPCLPSHWPRAELTLRRDGRELRFVLLRADPGSLLARAATLQAGVLPTGEWLAWAAQPVTSCFLVPLPA